MLHEDSFAQIEVARKAIVDDLQSRFQSRDPFVKVNRSSSSFYSEGGPRDYVSVVGVIACPICKIGKLQYSCASYNGHIHARCSTDTCVRWAE